MAPRGKEKRSHTRVERRLTLQTLTDDYGTIEIETANLSAGGAYCRSSREIPLMTQLRLSIFLPAMDGRDSARLHHPLEVDAVVVRSEPLDGAEAFRLAVFFAGMADQDRRVLESYLDGAGTDSPVPGPA